MRALVPVVAVLLVVGVGYLVYLATAPFAARRARRVAAKARWQVRHYGQDGATVVAVSLVLPTGEVIDEHVVARVPDDDPDWNAKFLLAKEEAAERAFHLDAGGGG